MQEKTPGIILHSIKHNDSTSIVSIYTQRFGRMAYMVYGLGKKKSLCRPALLQPLTLVDLDVAHSPHKDIQRIKDIRVGIQLTNISSDPVKNALALFLSEVLFRTLKQTDSDEDLFLFIESATLYLNESDASLANFHLVFLLKLTRFLGFEPNHDSSYCAYFDLLEGVFVLDKPRHEYFLDSNYSVDLHKLLSVDFTSMNQIVFSREKRAGMLNAIIEFYKLHIPDFHGVHSLDVLHSLFD